MATDEEIVEAYLRLRAGGKVAKALHASEQRVYRVIRAHGIEPTGLKEYRDRIRKFDEAGVALIVSEYETGISAAQLGKRLGCSTETILNVLKRAGIKIRSSKPRMTTQEKLKIKALYESGLTFLEVGERTNRSSATLIKMMHAEYPDIVRSGTVGPGSPHWMGGKTTSHGYVYIWVADDDPMASMRGKFQQYVLEHRLVMARKIGRPLLPTETVHHIDGDRANNAPENLELRQGKHGKHVVMRCLDCGSHNIGHKGLS